MKKTLSLLLVVVMLFSMCALSCTAAVNDAVIAIKATPTNGAGYQKGDVVTFEVTMETTDEIGNVGAGVFDFGYDSSVFAPIVDISSKTNFETAGVSYAGYAFDGGLVLDDYSSVKAGKGVDTEDAANGWDASIEITLAPKSNTFTDCSSETKVFSFQMKLREDAADDGAYTIGITHKSIENGVTLVSEELGDLQFDDAEGFGFTTSKIFDRPVTTVALAVAQPIVWKQNQVRPAESGIANAIDIGVKAEFTEADIPITFDAKGTSDNFAAVGAVLKVNGTAMDPAESAFVYEVSEGVFQYRVIIKDVAKDSDDVYTLQFFAKDTNGNYTYGETVDVTVADCDLTNLPA